MPWEAQIFIDAALLFSLRSAPVIFTAIADGLELQRGVSYLAHYLDDFVTVGPPHSDQCLINQSNKLGIPLALHKSVGPTSCLMFLGIEIDSSARELHLSHDKLLTLKELLTK